MRKKYLTASLLATLCLMSCQATTNTVGTDVSCVVFKPVKYSRKDTSDTIKQVRQNNAAWDAVCGEKDAQ